MTSNQNLGENIFFYLRKIRKNFFLLKQQK